jgi:hypothetical protein
MPCETSRHGLVARGGLGLPKVSLELALLYLFMPCRWPPLKRPDGPFRGGRPQGGQPSAIFYPIGHSSPYAYGRDGFETYVCL